jgi:hypothetical protein
MDYMKNNSRIALQVLRLRITTHNKSGFSAAFLVITTEAGATDSKDDDIIMKFDTLSTPGA